MALAVNDYDSPLRTYTMAQPKDMHEKTFQWLRRDVVDAFEREQWAFGIAVLEFARFVKSWL